MKAKKGSIAICSIGRVGVITSDTPVDVMYSGKDVGIAWIGICIDPEYAGKPWSSRNPTVVGHVDDYKKVTVDHIK